MDPVLQHALPYDPFAPRPLPGIAPLDPENWLRVDEAFAGQMAQRDALIATARDDVIAMAAHAGPAAQELLALVREAQLGKPGFVREGAAIRRPDGVLVRASAEDPLASAGRLAQEDFCLLEKPEGGDEHVLTGACLCFPASWSLQEKFLRPLVGIHVPVNSYDAGIARRVQRLFDGVQAARPLWRFNALWYDAPDLHQPRRENQRRAARSATEAAYLRSELQTIRRLPETGAVVFAIHTYVLARRDVPGQG